MAQWEGEFWSAVECGRRGGLSPGHGRGSSGLHSQSRSPPGLSRVHRRLRGCQGCGPRPCRHYGRRTKGPTQLWKIKGKVVCTMYYTHVCMSLQENWYAFLGFKNRVNTF